MISRRYVITSLSALALTLTISAAHAHDHIKVVASFSILGDLVKAVGGEHVELTTLVGHDGDAVSEAKIVFVNGLGFEGWMERLVESSATKAQIVTATTGIGEAEEHGHDDHARGAKHDHDHAKEAKKDDHGHDHDGPDPHAWQSVANAKIYVANIRDALIAAEPEEKAAFEANATAYLAELDALDTEVKAAIAALPKDGRTIITSHDAFGYFAHAYGIEVVAPQGISTESEASAKDVAQLIKQIRHEGVKAVFVENITDQRLIKRIADEGGARIGGDLYSDALSAPGGPAGTYIDMIRHNIRTVSAGLSS